MAATQNFRVSGFVIGLAIKAPCLVASNGNLTLSAAQTVNGVAVVASDRVLVKEQTDPIENGIYTVETSAWKRDGDFDGNSDVGKGTQVIVATSPIATIYQVTSANPITIDTSAINFALVTGVLITSTTVLLEDITDDINTVDKIQARTVYNTTTKKTVTADSATAGAVWVDATGATAHTPV